MDKKQLANKIWNAANEMRGSLDANDYKDFILGFLFYKFLSDKQTEFFVARGLPEEAIAEKLVGGDHPYSRAATANLGYYIAYDDLFSSWLTQGSDLSAADVSEGLRRFDNNVAKGYKHLYDQIFESFLGSIRKLGDNAAAQAKQLRKIMSEIKDVPTDDSLDYDVLGYIYEFLIAKFAANAGKKNGEFYTPHAVAVVMAELVAHHLQGRETVEIYDPTSGSGSLLLNIGSAIERHRGDRGKIRYYAQELKQDAYNLTRMNLVMRGVSPANIVTRSADSLGQDWPLIDDQGDYELLHVDAVVSNPPYSARWDRDKAIGDKRFAEFGYAPETKADYAFLLHELYHLKDDGILTIVLPHGVLFRGGDEEKIRRQLIEKNHIDTIIGFPPNVFYGTGIATIVMVLKKHRGQDETIQFVDASKGFMKAGTKNELRDRDVRRIVDTVIARKDSDKFSRVVSRDEIRDNDYNLNIPRYVDSSEDTEQFDIYSTMFGGIPNSEINGLNRFWGSLPGLRDDLFESVSPTHAQIRQNFDVTGADVSSSTEITSTDINTVVAHHSSVEAFTQAFKQAFDGFDSDLHTRLIDNAETLALNLVEGEIRGDLFNRMSGVPIIDEYAVYQLFADQWQVIEPDLSVIQINGWDATRGVEPHIVTKKKQGKDIEVQEGWVGTILPFDLVQRELLNDEFVTLNNMQDQLATAESRIVELFSLVDEEDYGSDDDLITTADGTKFAAKGVATRLKTLLADVTTAEITVLSNYLSLTAAQKRQAEVDHLDVNWEEVGPRGKTGLFTKGVIDARIAELKKQADFEDGSLESVLIEADATLSEIAALKKDLKVYQAEIHEKTRELIGTLSDDQVRDLLHTKWITGLMDALRTVPVTLTGELVAGIEHLNTKYSSTLADVNEQITSTQTALAGMMAQLTGNDTDLKGINALATMFGGK